MWLNKKKVNELESRVARIEKEWQELWDEFEKINEKKKLLVECREYIHETVDNLVKRADKINQNNLN